MKMEMKLHGKKLINGTHLQFSKILFSDPLNKFKAKSVSNVQSL